MISQSNSGLRSESDPHADCRRRQRDFSVLTRRILRYANQGVPRVDFLRQTSRLVLEYAQCDALEFRVSDGELNYCWEASVRPTRSSGFRQASGDQLQTAHPDTEPTTPDDYERLCNHVRAGKFEESSDTSSAQGSVWTSDAGELLDSRGELDGQGEPQVFSIEGLYKSLAFVRFVVDETNIGLLVLKTLEPGFFDREGVEFYEALAQTLGLSVADRRAQARLRERIKEQACMYGIETLTLDSNLSIEDVLQGIVDLLPDAWQFPDIACARLVLEGREFKSKRFRDATYRQEATIRLGEAHAGTVQVVYDRRPSELEEDAFLEQELRLLEAIGRQIGAFVDRRRLNDERKLLETQLQHADRLATIGELAAGVAHELNEPLSSMLGYAQLIQREPNLPDHVVGDLDRIVRGSLHARETIRQLLTFARQAPPSKEQLDLNRVTSDALSLLEGRLSRTQVALQIKLQPDLPSVLADPVQINQVIVNLLMNAIQAMPDGGELTIATWHTDKSIHVCVQDSGVGMSAEVKEKAFLPFFTTKDVNEGTGLGLSLAHGVTTAHGGRIDVESELGHGSRFEIVLPRPSPDAEVGRIEHGP